MALEFMVLGMPRSATTWCANWLTTEKTLCLHDPVLTIKPEELDSLPCDRKLGVSCSGLPLLRDFTDPHPARKVIVHRGRNEVNASLERIGLTSLGASWNNRLGQIKGMHVFIEQLFNPPQAKPIYEYLTGEKFDAARHALLVDMHIEPMFNQVRLLPDRAKGFRARVQEALA